MSNKITRTSSSFQYHIYVTMGCSLSCNHCFISDEIRKNKEQLTIEKFKLIVDAYSEHFLKSDAEKAEVTILGGEPTIIHPSFFKEAIPYLREKFEGTGKFFYVSLVTNLLHYPCLSQIYGLFDYISTSYEPERFALERDENKKSVWEANVKKLMSLGVELSLSVTTTSGVVSLGEKYLDTMYALGFKRFQINLSIPEGKMLENSIREEDYLQYKGERIEDILTPAYKRKPLSININTPIFPGFEKESKFMIAATEWLMKMKEVDPELDIYPISSYCTSLFSKTVVPDIACCANKGMNVRVDGEITGCATEIGSDNIFSYGNIFTSSVDEISNSSNAKKFIRSTKITKRECLRCKFFPSCEGGCLLRSKLWNSKDKSTECHGLRSFYQYIEDNAFKLRDLDTFK